MDYKFYTFFNELRDMIVPRYNEINDYDYKTASSTNGWPVLHFTQMVWKNTQKVGFGVATMPSVKYAKYVEKYFQLF